MGLYADLQKDLNEAFTTDLSDALRPVQYITLVDDYDDENLVSTQVEQSVTVNSIVLEDIESEIPNSSALKDDVEIFVLDSYKPTTLNFVTDMKIKDGNDTYLLNRFYPDPVKAGWTVLARRFG